MDYIDALCGLTLLVELACQYVALIILGKLLYPRGDK